MFAQRLLLLVTCGIAWSASPTDVRAQSAKPDIADAASALGFGTVSAGGSIIVESAPVLEQDLIRNRQAVLTVGVRYRQAGRLREPVAADALRLEAGALLFGATFGKGGQQADTLPAWCGSGQGGLFRRKITTCIIGSPDGQGRLADGVTVPLDQVGGPVPRGLVREAPEWYVVGVRSDQRTTPFPRPRIEPVERTELPLLQVSLVSYGKYRNHVELIAYISLASNPADRRELRTIEAPLEGATAKLAFGRVDLVLDVVEGGVRARWEPSSRAPRPPTEPTTAPIATSERPRPTPFVIAGALVNVAALSAAAGVVEPGAALASGPARHWSTARAAGEAHALFLTLRTPKDAVFHRVETVTTDGLGARTVRQAWCGPFAVGTFPRQPWCFLSPTQTGRSGMITPAVGRAWMLSPGPPAAGEGQAARLERMDLTPSAEDLLEPISFKLQLDGVGRDLKIRALALRNEDVLTLWRGNVPFGPDGVARIPLWSHQLVVTKSGRGVTALLEATGDGTGPLEVSDAH